MSDHSLFPSQELVNQLSEIKYNNINIYRYLIDNLVFFENEEEVTRNVNFSSEDLNLELEFSKEEAELYISDFLSNVPQVPVLAFNTVKTRTINDEEYLTVLDPYLDVLGTEKCCVIDMNDSNILNSFQNVNRHYPNVLYCHPQGIYAYKGLSPVDYDDLRSFMENDFFAIAENYSHQKLYSAQKDLMVAKVRIAMATRASFIEFYKKVLDIAKPEIVLYSHGANLNLCMLYEAASQKGIRCIEIDHSVNIYSVDIPQCSRLHDDLCVYSDILKDISLKRGAKNIVAIGKPSIVARKSNAPSNAKIVVSVISSCEQGLLEMAESLSTMLSPDSFMILYKKHGSERIFNFEEVKRAYPNLIFIDDVDINQVFEVSDVVIGHRTTALLEAMVYDNIKIILTKPFFDYCEEGDYAHFGYLIDQGEMVYAEQISDIVHEIQTYEKGKAYRNEGGSFWKKAPAQNFVNYINGIIGSSAPDRHLTPYLPASENLSM